MKKKIIIPLVTILFSALLIMGSANLFILKTREENKVESNNEIKENYVDKKDDEVEKVNDNEDSSNLKNDTAINQESNIKNEKVEENKENKKGAFKEEKKDVPSTNQENITEIKKEEIVNQNNSTNNQNSTVYEISDEDSKDKNNGNQDEEYLRIKSSCEFFTRSECQAALTDIQIKYLSSDHPMVSASCESFAYKGQVVGYRVLLTYGDGNFFYNN